MNIINTNEYYALGFNIQKLYFVGYICKNKYIINKIVIIDDKNRKSLKVK